MCEDLESRPELVLRRWADLDPSMEFRSFVKDGRISGTIRIKLHSVNILEGACQRNDTQYFSHLTERSDELWNMIDDFVQSLPCIFPHNSCIQLIRRVIFLNYL